MVLGGGGEQRGGIGRGGSELRGDIEIWGGKR